MKIPAGIDRFDKKIFCALLPYSSKLWLTNCMKVVSVFASAFFCLPMYGAAFFFTNHHPLVITIIVGECVQLPIIIALRLLVKRPRPVDKGKYYSKWNTYSFPSLHSSRAFMLAVIIGSFYSWVLAIALTTALLIAFSRLILQKHYISDIICGASIGLFAPATAMYFLRNVS